ncbi:MAG TPA: DUF2232 domain-containing protein [Thermoanaerobaculaceae bacterium]|nr:DUF2232 domain-containing protein [Thermoanaerobaculaceae bacterium]
MASGQVPPTPPSLRLFGPGMAGLFSLLVFASLPLLPILGVFLALLAPLPLVHVMAGGRTSFLAWGWVAVGLVAAVFLFRTPWLLAVCIGYLLVVVWPAVSIETWLRRPWTTGRWAAIVTLVALGVASGVAIAVFWPTLPGEGLIQLFSHLMAGASELVKTLGEGVGGEDLMARAMRSVAYLTPSMVALYVLSGALWLRPRLPLLGLARGGEPFPLYTSEEWLPVGFVVGGLGWVFAPEPYKWLASNLLVTVLGLYFIHGLAIILFYLGRRFGMNRWVRLGVVVLALQIPVALLFSAIGLADTFFGLRRGGAYDGGHEA